MIRKRVRSLKLRGFLWLLIVAGLAMTLGGFSLAAEPRADAQAAVKAQIPRFEIDSTWPKRL